MTHGLDGFVAFALSRGYTEATWIYDEVDHGGVVET